MKKFAVVLLFAVLFALPGFAQQHAISRVAKAAAKVATAPVVHPVRSLKDVIGGALFAVETPVDVAHYCFEGLDALTGDGLDPAAQRMFIVIHAPFYVGDKVTGKIDSGLEGAQRFFFGTNN